MANEFKIKKGLIVTGASGGTVVDIQGSQGQLFSVTDDLSGSIFAVSDISGVPILDINSSGLSIFDGSVGIGLTSTTANLEVKSIQDSSFDEGIGVVRSNTSQTGYINMVGGAMNINAPNAIPIKFRDGGNTNLTIGGDGHATFSGDVNANLNITAGSYSRVAGTTVSILTDAQQNSVLKFREDNDNYGFTLGYYGSPNNFVLTRHDNSATGDTVMSIPRNSSAVTFSTQAFATTATSSGDASSTLTTKGYVDGLITGATIYRGAWDPSGGGYGSPDLSGVTQTSGYYYICSAAGTAEPNGTGCEPDSWETGDWVIWNDDIVDCAGTGTGGWQKIDNSSVLSGVGTGQTVALWEGAGSVTDSETLGNAPITVSGNDTAFAGNITAYTGGGSGSLGVGRTSNQSIKLYVTDTNNSITAEQDSDGNSAHKFILNRVFDGTGANDFKIQKGGTDQFTLDTSANATFAGTVTSPTFLGDLNGTINTATTGVTQTAGDDSTKIATTAYADAAAAAVPIGNYLPLSAGSSYPLTGNLIVENSVKADAFYSHQGTYTGNTYVNDWQKVYSHNWSRFSFSAFTLKVLAGGNTANNNLNADVHINYKMQNGVYRVYANIVNYGSEALLAENFKINLSVTSAASGSWTIWHKIISNYQTPYYTLVGSGIDGTWYSDTPVASPTGDDDTWNERIILNSMSVDVDNSANVGIGTTNPGSLLEISQQLSAASTIDYPYIISSRDDGNSINQQGGEGVGIKFRIAGNDATTPGNSLVGASIAAIREMHGDTDSSTGLGFFITQNDETLDEALRIDHDGNVGIGTTSPGTKLTVDAGSNIASFRSVGSGQNNKELLIQTGGDRVILDAKNADDGTATALAFESGSSESMRISSDGNVGIGTTSPDSRLHVAKNGNANGGSILMGEKGNGTNKWSYLAGTHYNQDTGSTNGTGSAGVAIIGSLATETYNKVFIGGNPYELNAATQIEFWTHSGTLSTQGGTQRGYINNGGDWFLANTLWVDNADGNVGIGTTSPQTKLEVNGGLVKIVENSNIAFYGGDYVRVFGTQSYGFRNSGGSTIAQISLTGNSYFNGGNVGIGTTSPDTLLQTTNTADGTDYISYEIGNTAVNASNKGGFAIYELGTKQVTLEYYRDGSAITNLSTPYIFTIDTNSQERMRITNAGNVGIGTSTPNAKLDVQGTQGQLFSVTDDLSGDIFSVADISGVPIMNVNSDGTSYFDGSVGIGTTSPNGKLQVNLPSYTNEDTNSQQAIFGVDSGYGVRIGYNETDNKGYINVLKPTVAWGNLILQEAGGNVGIGTTSPDHTLMLEKDVDGEWGALRLFNYHSDGSTVGSVAINMDVRASNGQIARASIKSKESTADSPYSELGFFTSNTTSTAPSERMTIDKDGNVGVGTTAFPATDIGERELLVQGAIVSKPPGVDDYYSYLKSNWADDGAFELGIQGADTNHKFITSSNYYHGTQLNFHTSDQKRMVIDTNGNVGINETNPGVKLQLISADEQLTNFSSSVADQLAYSQINANSSTSGVITGAAALELVGKANGSGHGRHAWIGAEGTSDTTLLTKLKFKIRGQTASGYDWAGAAEAPTIMTLEGDGNVGIGTTNPSAKLEVNGALFVGDHTGTVTPTDGIWIEGADGDETQIQMYSLNGSVFHVKNAATKATIGYASSQDRSVNFTNSGAGDISVGIGTTSPGVKLDVTDVIRGRNSIRVDGAATGSPYFGLYQNGSEKAYIQYVDSGDNLTIQSDGIVTLKTGSTERMRITSGGNVGIGINNPSALLEVRKGNISGQIAKFSAINAHVVIESSTAGNAVLHLKPNATGSKFGQFKVTAGNGYGFSWSNDAAGTGETTYMDLDTSSTGGGDLTVKGDVIAYGAPSDRKYKENIKPIESALDKAMQLQGVTFDWKDSESILDIKEDIGFIAQDVEKVLPELVRDSGKGNLSLRYQGITPILLEAIKELKAEIEELKKQIK